MPQELRKSDSLSLSRACVLWDPKSIAGAVAPVQVNICERIWSKVWPLMSLPQLGFLQLNLPSQHVALIINTMLILLPEAMTYRLALCNPQNKFFPFPVHLSQSRLQRELDMTAWEKEPTFGKNQCKQDSLHAYIPLQPLGVFPLASTTGRARTLKHL